MKTQKTLWQLKDELETLSAVMPYNHDQQRTKAQQLFLLAREIEKLENPTGYAENSNHWDDHEIRF